MKQRSHIVFSLLISLFWISSGLAQSLDEGVAAYQHKDYAKALRIFEAAGLNGNAEAQHNAGYMYRVGEGTKEDLAKAMAWYARAAERGFAPSQFNLGVMYGEGEGVKADPEAALTWFRKSAAQGYVDAQLKLAEIALANDNKKEAFFWYKKAADNGDANAIFNVASFYYKGFGVAKDQAKAVEYYRKARDAGQPGAASILKQLGVEN